MVNVCGGIVRGFEVFESRRCGLFSAVSLSGFVGRDAKKSGVMSGDMCYPLTILVYKKGVSSLGRASNWIKACCGQC